MDVRASRNLLKVDAISMPLTEHRQNYFVVIYNINIPIEHFESKEKSVQVLERVRHLLSRDFEGSEVVYQITASYRLVHSISGVHRIWTGSFSVRDNALAKISGFEDFDSETFVESSLDHLEDVEEKLERPTALASNWKLDQIISIIFYAQSKVHRDSLILQQFPRHGYKSRRTFPLP